MLGKTKKNLALKITLGLVLALPVGTALAADTATIVDYDALTVYTTARAIRKQILLLQILNAVKRNVYMEFLLGIKPF